MTRLDPAYRARYHDGSELLVRSDPAAMRAEIARVCGPADAAAYDSFRAHLARLYEVEMPNFIDTNFDTPLDLARSPKAAVDLVRLGALGKLGPFIRRWFTDPRLHRLFTFQALYAGLPPENALALYAVITHMDSMAGVYAPEGGMGALPAGLAEALAPHAAIHYDTTVTRLLRRADGGVAGVEVADGTKIAADAVVCTLDLPVAYRTLLPELRAPLVVRRGRYSPSAVVWHLGVRGDLPEQVAHHNIHFGQEWNESFEALIDRGEMMPDPSRLVTVSSHGQPDLAPPGCHTLYVLEPVPNLSGRVDWSRERVPMAQRLLDFLDAEGYPTDVVADRLFTPVDWRDLGMEQGTPFGLAHLFRQTGPFRPANHEHRVPGLFFAGSSTVPGVGVPMVLISGKLAAGRVREYLR